MDAASSDHPRLDVLSSFGLGRLDEPSAEVVSKHLEQCPDCRRQVAEMSADSFLGRVRDAQGAAMSTYGKSQTSGSTSGHGSAKAVSRPTTHTLPPGLADHPDYEIKRELGRGGMGVVYLAHNRLMGRDEVLKVMGRNIMERPGVLDRFVREIRAVAKLRHANIVTAYHAFRLGDSFVFAMEHVEGLDLSRMVKAKGALPVGHACNFVYQAALGLQHAHEEGLVHRDIKPGNLMLARSGNKATIKILDFGLAKASREQKLDGALTNEGQALGTPDFIAPEQIVNAPGVDIRADIYSLGGTLYYLLTGRPPFQENSLYDMYQAHISRDADPLNLIRPEAPVELAALVAKMMAKEAAERFQIPSEVAQALTPFFKPAAPQPSRSSAEVARINPQVLAAHSPVVGPAPVPASAHRVALPPTTRKSPNTGAEGLARESLFEMKEHGPSANAVKLRPAESKLTLLAGLAHRPPWAKAAIAAAVLLLGLLAAWQTVLRVKTSDGIIEILNLPADAEVFVDGEKVAVTWPAGDKPAVITATAGTHKVKVKTADVQTTGDEVTVQAGGKVGLTIRLLELASSRPGRDDVHDRRDGSVDHEVDRVESEPDAGKDKSQSAAKDHEPASNAATPAVVDDAEEGPDHRDDAESNAKPALAPPTVRISEQPLEAGKSVPTNASKKPAADGWRSLFNGKDFNEWENPLPGNGSHWSVENGVLVARGSGVTGKPTVLLTRQDFANFRLQFQFLFERVDGGGGVEIHRRAGGDSRSGYGVVLGTWPTTRGPQSRPVGSITKIIDLPYGINPTICTLAEPTDVAVNAWNKIQITAVANRIAVRLNERLVVQDADHSRFYASGKISLCGWAQHVVRFRDIRIQELPARTPTGRKLSKAKN
jgi:serine/threonine protein kinase